MTNDPLDAMMARWNHIQGSLFPWLREEVDPITEALARLVTTLDVIGLEAFVPERPRTPARGSPRPRQGLRRQGDAGRSHYQRPDRAPRRRQVAAPHPRLGTALSSALGSHVFPRFRGVRAGRSARQDARGADRAYARRPHGRRGRGG